ncbi:MAG: ionic transporter y4hA [Acetobacteraceae bacterium]|nr:ionic transporter y4hA [Acetobacteraceae bacterium]
MAQAHAGPMPWWAWLFPILGVAALAVGKGLPAPVTLALLMGCVFASVRHAETVATRLGEPLGTLVLALAVTVLEAGMIVSMMMGGSGPTVARDAIFAALMIALNGIIGLSLVLGGARHFAQSFRAPAANAFLAVLVPLSVLTLVLPTYTVTTPGPLFATPQLVFVAVVALLLYGCFLYVQLVRHRADFLADHDIEAAPADRPAKGSTAVAAVLLAISLAAVILLAKMLSPALEAGVAAIGAPAAMVGVAIATLVLLPEGITAVKAAARNNLQTALNLALGSIAACIGLTIPVVAVVALILGEPLHLGLEPAMTALLATTYLMLAITLNTGRTTVLEGIVHLSVFAAFLMFTFLP